MSEYSNISREQLYLLSRAEFERRKLITSDFAIALFGTPKKAATILDSLRRKRRLVQIERGKYLIVPLKAPNQEWSPNEFLVAHYWMGSVPYYIGYFTMYNYWGFTDQVPQTIFIPNLKKSREKIIGGVRYRASKINQSKLYGLQTIRIEDEEVCISDKERTLVDFVYNPLGSLENIRQVLSSQIQRIDIDKFTRYLIKFPTVAVQKRAGYLMQQSGYPEIYLTRVKKSIGNDQTFVALDPIKKSKSGNINNEWKVIVNR